MQDTKKKIFRVKVLLSNPHPIPEYDFSIYWFLQQKKIIQKKIKLITLFKYFEMLVDYLGKSCSICKAVFSVCLYSLAMDLSVTIEINNIFPNKT